MIDYSPRETVVVARGRSRFADGMMAAGSATLLVAGLAAVDTRVRDFMTGFLRGDSLHSLAQGFERSQRWAHGLMDTAGYSTVGYEPLVMFAIVGLVFLVLMMKS
jgi:hypothetical protein